MNLTPQQVEQEFRRQVGLCSSIGAERMLELIVERFAPAVLTPTGRAEWLMSKMTALRVRGRL